MQKANRFVSFVSKIKFANFRNYSNLELDVSSNINLITGPNGIGKTNILEAISLIAPGRGLRGAKLDEMNCLSSPEESWSLNFLIKGKFSPSNISISYQKKTADTASKKLLLIDNKPAKNKDEINSNIGICWLTPQMDQIFLQGGTARRKFIDRIIAGFIKEHSSALAKYDYLLKERINILNNSNYDQSWISIVERKIAETSVIIAEARKTFCEEMNKIIKNLPYNMPKATICFDGFVENKFGNVSSLQLEDEICEILQHNRRIDAHVERTKAGIHLSDLVVCDSVKGLNVKFCSTGEQKSLLLSIFLGEIFAHIKMYNRVPIVLLDDIFSHLDEKKRKIINEVIKSLGAQVFISAVDADSLGIEEGSVDKITVVNNEIKRLN